MVTYTPHALLGVAAQHLAFVPRHRRLEGLGHDVVFQGHVLQLMGILYFYDLTKHLLLTTNTSEYICSLIYIYAPCTNYGP